MVPSNKTLERLNILTGFILLVISGIDFLTAHIPQAASWFIFGSMYLVMDGYKQDNDSDSSFNRTAKHIRWIFGWIGFTAAFAFLIYRLWITM